MKNLLFRRLIISLAIGILGFVGYCVYSTNLPETSLPTIGFFMSGTMDYVPGEVLVKYKTPNRAGTNGISVSSFNSAKSLPTSLSKQNLSVEDTIPEGNIAVISIQDDKTVEETIEILEKDKNIEYAEPNYIYHTAVINTNDPYTGNLWGLENIDWVQAYQVFSGSFSDSNTGIIIGVIDEGVNYNHEDLSGNMRSNLGYDFLNNDPNPLPSIGTHGTHVAGTIAAKMNNGKGIIGVNPNAKIMSLKVSDNSWMPTAYIINAINYAIENGVKIINASRGGTNYSSGIYEAIKRFKDEGGLFITAAGNNDNRNNDLHPYYPCSYNLDNIICVAATDQNSGLASFSHYGETSVDVGAPGTSIYSTVIQEYSENAIFFQENFSGYESIDDLYTTGYTTGGNLTPVLNYLYLQFDDEHALSGSYLESPIRDISFSGDYEVQVGSISICTGNGDLQLQVKTGTSWQVISGYKENIDDYERIEYNANIGKASSFQFRFYFYDNTPQTGFTCYVNTVKYTVYKDYAGLNDLYSNSNGTSMATPHVAGLASLAWSFRPDLTYTGIKQAIMENGDSLDSLLTGTVSGKRINAYKTLVALDNYPPESPTLLSPSSGYQYTGFDDTLQVSFQWSGSHDTGVGVSGYTFELSNNSGFNSLLTGIRLDNTGLSFDITSTGIYYWRIKAFDKKGNTGNYSNIYSFSVEKSNCLFDGTIVNHGESVTGYKKEVVQSGSTCESQIRTCTNGVLSGTFEYSSCEVIDEGNCFFSGNSLYAGIVVQSGESITGYQSGIVPYGQSCVSEIRTCINGTLSGTFAYGSCNVEPGASCTFSGTTVNHGSSVTGYKSSTVPYGQSCESEIRTCTNGTLSGTFAYSSCNVEPGASCTFSGTTVNHGSSVTGYKSSTVPYGQSCESEIRTCTNGTLSGTFAYSSCNVEPGASCTFSGTTVNHGSSVTGYKSSTVPYGQSCESEIRTCINGTLSGTFAYSSCSVQSNESAGGGGGGLEPKIPTIMEKVIESINLEETLEEKGKELNSKEILKNGYSREMNDAYEFAYKNGITTRKSINQANMTGSLTRAAMAKMLSQYAINVLGKTPGQNNLKNCNFPDVTKEMDVAYDNGITLVCQLGIMGVGITNFRPNEPVTRAQFGTALSRMLYGLADGKEHYYTTHLAKLKAEGIISNDNPTLKELRGYVMLMLMRSAE